MYQTKRRIDAGQSDPYMYMQKHNEDDKGPTGKLLDYRGPTGTLLDERGPTGTLLDGKGPIGTLLDERGPTGTLLDDRGRRPTGTSLDGMSDPSNPLRMRGMARPKTQRVFQLRGHGPVPIRDFDDSDLSSELSSTNGVSIDTEKRNAAHPAVVQDGEPKSLVPRSVPSHLLMVSILEQLCILYGNNGDQGKQLFKVICEHLVQQRVISPLTILDEMNSIRAQYRVFIHSVLRSALVKVNKQIPALPSGVDVDRPVLSKNLSSSSFEEALHSQTSRYGQEFTEVERIGRGGFGAVYKARNNLDGRMYAIKKIKFKHSMPEIWIKVLREVKALANLQHPNIIGYNAAWVEHNVKTHDGGLPQSCSPSRSSEDQVSLKGDSIKQRMSVDDSIMFAESSKDLPAVMNIERVRVTELDSSSSSGCRACEILQNEESVGKDRQKVGLVKRIPKHSCVKQFLSEEFPRSYSHVTSESIESESSSVSIVKALTLDRGKAWENLDMSTFWDRRLTMKRSISCDPIVSGEKSFKQSESQEGHLYTEENIHSKFFASLFIQMELCSLTLKDWIQERNQICSCHKEFQEYTIPNMKIFKQILKGVEFIHSNGLIHRDLKPKNIFLHMPELHVKIGDFGLAKDDLTGYRDSDELLLTPSPVDVYDEFTWDNHTSGVGTSTYAAPEQLRGSVYSNKSDIYSLGIILFEEFSMFKTEMEKYHTLEELRKEGTIAPELYQCWPVHASYIRRMTNIYPHERPTAKSMLKSELFLTKDQIILNLKKELSEKDAEIMRLKELLKEKDNTISCIQREVHKVYNVDW